MIMSSLYCYTTSTIYGFVDIASAHVHVHVHVECWEILAVVSIVQLSGMHTPTRCTCTCMIIIRVCILVQVSMYMEIHVHSTLALNVHVC